MIALQITCYTESKHFLVFSTTLQIKILYNPFSALELSYCETLGKSHLHSLPLNVRPSNEQLFLRL